MKGVLLVFAAAVAFTILLVALVPDEVFVSDAAVKAMMMRQFARGNWAPDLQLPSPPWAQDLWNAGLYPLTPHHVEKMNGRWYIQWSLAFPGVTAPFYRVGGFGAALLVPLLATWAIWLSFVKALRAMGTSERAAACGLAGLAFATFLTFYSATYWEHTIAVALAFGGGALLLSPPRLSRGRAILGSLLAGSCVCFREEAALVVGFLGLATHWRIWRERPGSRDAVAWRLLALAALGTLPLLYLVWNHHIYGSIWGVHVMSVNQWLEEDAGAASARNVFLILRGFVDHAPVLLLAPLALAASCRSRRPAGTLFLLVGLLFVVGLLLVAPFQGGREWGPRYLLPAVPFLAVAATVALEDLTLRPGLKRTVALTAAGALLIWGARNVLWLGVEELRNTYGRRYETLRGVRADARAVVAVSHPFVTQQLGATIPAKTFFLTPGAEQLRVLGDGLVEQGIDSFLYLCNPMYGCGPTREGAVGTVRLAGRRAAVVVLRHKGPIGRYLAYDGRVWPFDFARGGRVELSADDADPLLVTGWSPVRRRREAVPFRWTVPPESCLLLPVSTPTNLCATVRARGLRARLPQALVVRLNGETLARSDLDSVWSDLRFVAHANQWVAGGNTLCLDFGAKNDERDGAVGAVAFVELRP